MTDQVTDRQEAGAAPADADDEASTAPDETPAADATSTAPDASAKADAAPTTEVAAPDVAKAAASPAGEPSGNGAAVAHEAPRQGLAHEVTDRDPHLDNVKFVAIVLVVVGHAWGPMLAWSRTLEAAYLFLYTVHMPIFVLLSGYFSRHFTASPRQARSMVRSIVVPYLIVETGFCLFRYFGAGQELTFALQDPWWVTWFLMTLFLWRLTAPLWRVVRFPIVLSVVISLAAGSQSLTETLELGRLLQYLPFFVIGLSLRQEHFAWLRTKWARLAAVPVLATACYLAYVLAPSVDVEWVYWRLGNDQLDVPYLMFAAVKLLQLAGTVLVIAAVIALVPPRRIPVITGLGAVSMFAYLLHGFVTKGAEWWGGYDFPFVHTHLGIVTVTFAAVALTFVLCSAPVRVLFSWAIQPRLEGWLRGSEGAVAPTGTPPRR